MASDLQSFAALVGAQLHDRQYRGEVEAEILDHLEQATAALEATGFSTEAAHRQAVAAFGDPALIGRLLQDTPKEGDLFMKLARLGGICGILAGLSMGLNIFVDYFFGHYRTFIPAFFATPPVLLSVQFAPILLMLLTLACTYAHQPGSRGEKGFLLAVQMAGGLICFADVAIESPKVALLGLLVMCTGTVLAGVLLAVRQKESSWLRGSAMVVAGLSMPFFSTVIFARIGHTLGYAFAVLTTVAWIVVGQALLAAHHATEPAQAAN